MDKDWYVGMTNSFFWVFVWLFIKISENDENSRDNNMNFNIKWNKIKVVPKKRKKNTEGFG